MRENLLFLGIVETQNEDCTEKVKMFCKDELQLQHDTVESIVIDRTLRMGKLRPGSIRHIVVKLHRYNEREIIREKASELRDTQGQKLHCKSTSSF